MGFFVWIVFLCLPLAVGGWLLPQITKTYQRLLATIVGSLAVLAIIGWFALRGKTGYDGLPWEIGIGAVGIGILTGGFTQFWILVHRDGNGPHPGERKTRMIFAGVSIATLLLLISNV